MENFNYFNIAMAIYDWVRYVFWIIIFSSVIFVSIIGLRKNKNRGFIFILISGCLSLIYHLPSIYFKGYYAIQRFTPAELGEIMIKFSYINLIFMPLIALSLVIGLFNITLEKK